MCLPEGAIRGEVISMRCRSIIAPLALALLLSAGSYVFSSNGDVAGNDSQTKEAVTALFVPAKEVDDIFDAREELGKVKALLADMQSKKEFIERSYKEFAKEADIERKRAKGLEKEIEDQNTLLGTIEDKEGKKATKEKISKLKRELKAALDKSQIAAGNADVEIRNAEDMGRKIKLFEERIEKAHSKVSYEIRDLYNKYLWKALTFVLIILAVIIIRIILLRLVDRYIKRDDQKYYYNKIVKVGSWATVILFIIFILIGKLQHFMLLISFVGAGVAIALKDVITSFVAWFFIIGPNGFRVGDRIELGDVRGDVIDVALFRTTLMEIGGLVAGDQAAGRIATFPNHMIFMHTLYNYTTGSEFIWNEISFLVTFESNWRRAEEIILGIAREGSDRVIRKAERKMKTMSRKYMVRFGVLTPAVYLEVEDSGIKLTVRYLTDARMRRVFHDKISRAILDEINSAGDINFAYPTIRYYKRGEESK